MSSGEFSLADELGKLADLRDRAALSEEEFLGQKAKLLAYMNPTSETQPEGQGSGEIEKYDIFLTSCGKKKIQVIKEIRRITGMGLKETKDLVEAPPATVLAGATHDEAESVRAALERAGAAMEVIRRGQAP